jgi:predicted component of type VI protein secretion system
MLRSTFTLSILAASLALAGCSSVGPDYQRPALDTSVNFNATLESGQVNKANPVDLLAGIRY